MNSPSITSRDAPDLRTDVPFAFPSPAGWDLKVALEQTHLEERTANVSRPQETYVSGDIRPRWSRHQWSAGHPLSQHVGLILVGFGIDDQIGALLLRQPILFVDSETEPDLHSDLGGKEIAFLSRDIERLARPLQSERLHSPTEMSPTLVVGREEHLVRGQTTIRVAFAIRQQPNDHIGNTVLGLKGKNSCVPSSSSIVLLLIEEIPVDRE